MNAAVVKNNIEQELAKFNEWRTELTDAIAGYQEWLEKTGQMEMSHSLRFYELTEAVRSGRLTLAFVAEFSRGKSELINALFFSDFKQRLLPSDVGRTTMCPTEISHDPNEEPFIRLLPIESRYRSESIAQLKNMPIEWIKIRLNLNSASDMKSAMATLAETKKIFVMEAKMMGLTGETLDGAGGSELQTVEVPAWRYALINYPHPLLTNGISIVDTPGLNALGLEPELTLSTIPNAHAVVFLLGIDTGVTRSDMEVWQKYVPASVTHRIALLNKIDLLWDDLKSRDEIQAAIQRQIDSTASILKLPVAAVLPISAQKALIGKIKNDPVLLERSGIGKLETMIARDIIPARRKIVTRAVITEIGAMMISSRKTITGRIASTDEQLGELSGLSGKSKAVVTRLWEHISAIKSRYTDALSDYRTSRKEFGAKRDTLMEMLNPVKLEYVLKKSADAIGNTWTTLGLTRGMHALLDMMSDEFDRIYRLSEEIKLQMQRVYDSFNTDHQFPPMTIPPLDLESMKLKLQVLATETDHFCHDPVNIMTEKHFLIRKFYSVLVAQAQQLFANARRATEKWAVGVPLPLEHQIREYKAQLDERLGNLSRINEDHADLQERMQKLKTQRLELNLQREMIEELISKVTAGTAR